MFELESNPPRDPEWVLHQQAQRQRYQRLQPHLWGPRFSTEPDAVARCRALLTPYFHLLPEVRLAHPERKNLRVDLVAVARRSALPFVTDDIVGIEIKNSFFGDHTKFRRALAQALSYRAAIVDDRRTTTYRGRRLRYVFVFPGPYGMAALPPLWDATTPRDIHGDLGQICGATLLAGRFNVGTLVDRALLLSLDRPWSPQPFEFQLSGSPIWDPIAGCRGNALRRGPDDQVGSA